MAEEYTIMLYVNFALERIADLVSNTSAVLGHGPPIPFLFQNGLLTKSVVPQEFCVVLGEKSLTLQGF